MAKTKRVPICTYVNPYPWSVEVYVPGTYGSGRPIMRTPCRTVPEADALCRATTAAQPGRMVVVVPVSYRDGGSQ